MHAQNLPALRLSQAWQGEAPNPLTEPRLYEGVMLRRVVGYALDVVILSFIAIGVWAALGVVGILTFGLLLPLQALAMAILPLAYHTCFIGLRGATPGMQLVDVQVRCFDGTRPDLVNALVMTVLFYLSITVTTFLILIVSFFNERHRTMHDYFSGTVVVRSSVLAGSRPLEELPG